MEIPLNKKQLTIVTISLLIIASGYMGCKYYKESQYLKKVEELKTDMLIVSSLSEQVTNEYSDIWQKQIKNNYYGINVDGETKHFYSVEEAVKYKMDKFSEMGILDAIDSLSNSITKIMHNITPPPSKYKDLHSTLIKLYADGNEYVSLAKSPVGSLMSFNEKRSELTTSIKREIDEIDIVMPFQTNLSQKILEVKNEISNKQLKKELDKKKSESEIQKKSLQQYTNYKRECEKYLVDNAKKQGVITTASGLQYEIIKKGSGSIPKDNDKVKVHYHGTLIDGTVFDSSVDRKEPIIFQLDQVIKGWTEALKMMPVGSKYKLYVPQQLAYADADRGKMKPYSMLIFEVKLISIEK